jgi:hypothetical protein
VGPASAKRGPDFVYATGTISPFAGLIAGIIAKKALQLLQRFAIISLYACSFAASVSPTSEWYYLPELLFAYLISTTFASWFILAEE